MSVGDGHFLLRAKQKLPSKSQPNLELLIVSSNLVDVVMRPHVAINVQLIAAIPRFVSVPTCLFIGIAHRVPDSRRSSTHRYMYLYSYLWFYPRRCLLGVSWYGIDQR